MTKTLRNTNIPFGYELTLKVLGESESLSAENTLFAALSDPHPQTQERIFDILIKRSWQSVGPRIVASYNTLTPCARAKVLENIDALAPYLKKSIEGESSEARSNALRIISNANRISLLPLTLGLLRKFEERYRKRVEKIFNNNVSGLLNVLHHSKAEHFEELPHAITRAAKTLLATLSEALRSFSKHRLRCVIRGLLRMGRSGHMTLLPYFNEQNPEIVKQISDILSNEGNPEMQPFVALLLTSKSPVAVTKGTYFFNYASSESVARIASAVINQANVTKLGQVEQNLGKAKWWKTVTKYVGDFDAVAQKILLDQIKQQNVPSEIANSLLQAMLNSAYAEVRQKAMLLAKNKDRDKQNQSIKTLIDHNESVQMQATQELINSKSADREELIVRQLLSEFPVVRAVAGKEVAQFDFRSYFKAFEKFNTKSRHKIAQAIKRVDPDISAKLRKALGSNEPYTREKTMHIIGILEIGADFTEEILATVLPGNSIRARIAALEALHGIDKPSANQAATKCLSDEDRRIVVAAMETLAKNRCAKPLAEVMKLTTHPGPRVRAELVLYLDAIGNRHWRDELEKMLADSVANMRVAAISVIMELQHETGLHMLSFIASSDKDARVRSIAKEALNRLASTKTEMKGKS